jgi:hypothetical protein
MAIRPAPYSGQPHTQSAPVRTHIWLVVLHLLDEGSAAQLTLGTRLWASLHFKIITLSTPMLAAQQLQCSRRPSPLLKWHNPAPDYMRPGSAGIIQLHRLRLAGRTDGRHHASFATIRNCLLPSNHSIGAYSSRPHSRGHQPGRKGTSLAPAGRPSTWSNSCPNSACIAGAKRMYASPIPLSNPLTVPTLSLALLPAPVGWDDA